MHLFSFLLFAYFFLWGAVVPAPPGPNVIYFEYPERGGQLAVRIGDWKGVKRNVRQQPDTPWEIYNLAADPSEKHNQAATQPALARRFDAIVEQEHQPAHIREWEFIQPKFY